MAEAIKDAKHLQTNMTRYLTSSNTYIAEEYNFIRANLIKQVRLLDQALEAQNEEDLTLIFGKIERESKAFDTISGRALDGLIRENRITNTMATSLMNDTAYAFNIITNLTNMVKILLVYRANYPHAYEEIFLEDEEN